MRRFASSLVPPSDSISREETIKGLGPGSVAQDEGRFLKESGRRCVRMYYIDRPSQGVYISVSLSSCYYGDFIVLPDAYLRRLPLRAPSLSVGRLFFGQSRLIRSLIHTSQYNATQA